MATLQEQIDALIVTITANDSRLDVLLNGTDTDTYETTDLRTIPSYPKFLADKGVVANIVDFPLAADSAGTPGDLAFGVVSGITWLAIYTGDGVTHSWAFSPMQTTYPS